MVEWNVFPLAKPVLPIALFFRIGLAEVSKMILYTTLAYIKIPVYIGHKLLQH
jgi:hypothetical protein